LLFLEAQSCCLTVGSSLIAICNSSAQVLDSNLS
jgi:hypothetical protein